MSAKIFYRTRVKTKEGAQTPRFRVVGISGMDLRIYANHLRKKELQQIAKETGAELIELKRDKDAKKNNNFTTKEKVNGPGSRQRWKTTACGKQTHG